MDYNNMKKQFPAFSALFNLTPMSTFMRDGISNQVNWLFDDGIGVNLDINNEGRLKTTLYSSIRDMYNERKRHHGLLIKDLPYVPYDDMIKINKLQLKFDKKESSSGRYVTYPKTFYCEKCGNFIYLRNETEFENFNPKKCRRKGCDGQYTQFQFVGFCEDCGAIIPCYQGCKDHRLEDMELIRRDPDDLKTWKLRCRICGYEKDFVPLCYHTDSMGNSFFEKKMKPRLTYPLNMNDGSVFKSVVKTVVDIPEGFGKDFQSGYISDYALFGLYLEKFDDLYRKVNFRKIMDDLDIYHRYIDEDEDDMEDDEFIKFKRGGAISGVIESLQKDYSIEDISEINDYLILSSFFDKNKNKNLFIPSYNEYFESKTEVSEGIDLDSFENKEDYESFKNDYNISNIIYIPDIHLISASIGKIRGVNKFYDEDFVPHFEPHWANKAENKIRIFAYPFQTEGLLIDLDKIKIVNWLINNGKLIINGDKITDEVTSYDDAKEILFNLEEDKANSSYYEVKTLLHTFSHVLMSRSSLYTGLDVNSCSEIIFPKSGSFVIYSTSNINIGGFKFVFENSLKNWFDEVKLDVNDCIFDPTCIQEKGACFSCLHLPEYVCSEFNEYLDRDVFIGKHRYDVGFWNDY